MPTATPKARPLYFSTSSRNASSSPSRVARISWSSGVAAFPFIGRRRHVEYSTVGHGISVDFSPVLPPAHGNGQGHRQRRHPLHRLREDALGLHRLRLRRLHDQFVVHLEDQTRLHPP